ncbi:hypothetical protein [Geodermatophilus obscurus]|uniref:hypothetical protein n=1 Tax=Geodermatophilus obscurus TaxID=1861 RepID=UPI00019B8AE2|nr:hypothetical protein [Geodermatophilus obscurus]
MTGPGECETALERLHEKIAARKILAVYTPAKRQIRRRLADQRTREHAAKGQRPT